MTEILQKSDFVLKVSFIDIFRKHIKVEKFKLAYSTALSTPIIATFNGVNYSSNCKPSDGGVLVVFDNPKLM